MRVWASMYPPCSAYASIRRACESGRVNFRGWGGLGFRVPGSGFWVSGSGFRVPVSAFRVLGSFLFLVPGFGFWVSSFGLRVSGDGFRVSCFRFRGLVFLARFSPLTATVFFGKPTPDLKPSPDFSHTNPSMPFESAQAPEGERQGGEGGDGEAGGGCVSTRLLARHLVASLKC